LRSSHPKKTRDRAPEAARVPLGVKAARKDKDKDDTQERAFLVGIDVRTRGRSGTKGTVTAKAARDAASTASAAGAKPQSSGQSAGKSATNKPSIPEFDAEESLAELRTLAESAGA